MQGGGLLEDLYSLRLGGMVVYYVLSDGIAVSELVYLYIVALLLSSSVAHRLGRAHILRLDQTGAGFELTTAWETAYKQWTHT